MLGITDFSAFSIAVLVFLMIPGPGTFCLLASVDQGEFRAGVAAIAGLVAADQVLMWLAAAGVAAILQSHPTLFKALQYTGAAYIAWIGMRLVARRDGARSPIEIEPRRYARQAFFITITNPKAIVFYMAFFPLFIDPATQRGAITFAAMAATILGISIAYCLLLCACTRAVASRLRRSERIARWLERAAGLSLIGFGIKLGTQ